MGDVGELRSSFISLLIMDFSGWVDSVSHVGCCGRHTGRFLAATPLESRSSQREGFPLDSQTLSLSS